MFLQYILNFNDEKEMRNITINHGRIIEKDRQLISLFQNIRDLAIMLNVIYST